MNKLQKSNLIQIGLWLLGILLLMIIILIEKNETLYKALGYVFFATFFIFPPVLVSIHLLTYYKEKDEAPILYKLVPTIGCFIYTLLAFIYFVRSLDEIGQSKMVLVVVITLLYYVVSSFVIYAMKPYQYKWHAILTTLALLFFFAFIGAGIYTSFYYSIMW